MASQLWFSEGAVPGVRHGKIKHEFLIDKVLFEGRSEFQEILVFDSKVYGRVLVLDNIVQFSTLDERIYHEMLVHSALYNSPKIDKALIIGGGDGATAREVLRYKNAKVTMIELDPMVVEVTRRFFPDMWLETSKDPRFTLAYEDGVKFVQRCNERFDLIVVDGSDPVGPSTVLFEDSFYRDLKSVLSPEGTVAFQIGSFLDLEFIRETSTRLRDLFEFVQLLRISMPSYHCGDYCFMFARTSSVAFPSLSGLLTEEHILNSKPLCSPFLDSLSYFCHEYLLAGSVIPKGFL